MPRWRTLGLGAALLALSACGGKAPPDPPPATPEPVAVPVPPALPEPRETRQQRTDRFCSALVRVVEAEASGFAPLIGGEVGERSWRGAVTPAGMSSCQVQGRGRGVAEYVCRGGEAYGSSAAAAVPVFEDIAFDVAACLGRASWFPRDWRPGEVRSFGRGERLVTWRDLSSSPRPAVQLKLEEDFLRRRYVVRLAVVTMP